MLLIALTLVLVFHGPLSSAAAPSQAKRERSSARAGWPAGAGRAAAGTRAAVEHRNGGERADERRGGEQRRLARGPQEPQRPHVEDDVDAVAEEAERERGAEGFSVG